MWFYFLQTELALHSDRDLEVNTAAERASSSSTAALSADTARTASAELLANEQDGVNRGLPLLERSTAPGARAVAAQLSDVATPDANAATSAKVDRAATLPVSQTASTVTHPNAEQRDGTDVPSLAARGADMEKLRVNVSTPFAHLLHTFCTHLHTFAHIWHIFVLL